MSTPRRSPAAVAGPALRTERLALRRWRDADRGGFHALNADPLVMATIGPVMSRPASDAFLDQIESHFERHGFGLWCVEHDGEMVGFTGLWTPWFRDGIEIGWRIGSDHWGNGFAPEAARAVLDLAFGRLGFDEVISFTARVNRRSLRVMDKVGLRRDESGDFDHPGLPEGDPLRPHLLFRLTADEHHRSARRAGAHR